MVKSRIFLAALFLVFGLSSAFAGAFAGPRSTPWFAHWDWPRPTRASGQWVDLVRAPAGSLALVRLLAEGGAFRDRLLLEGFQDVGSVSEATCRFVVLRPELPSSPAAQSPADRLDCAFKNRDGTAGKLRLKLHGIGFEAWGRRTEKSVSFSGDLATRLFRAISLMVDREPNNRDFARIGPICGPDGVTCVEIVVVNQKPKEDSAGALVCSFETDSRVLVPRARAPQCVVVE